MSLLLKLDIMIPVTTVVLINALKLINLKPKLDVASLLGAI